MIKLAYIASSKEEFLDINKPFDFKVWDEDLPVAEGLIRRGFEVYVFRWEEVNDKLNIPLVYYYNENKWLKNVNMADISDLIFYSSPGNPSRWGELVSFLLRSNSIDAPKINLPETQIRFTNKDYLFELEQKNIRIPETKIVSTTHEFMKAAEYFLAKDGMYVAKPWDGGGGDDVALLTTNDFRLYRTLLENGTKVLIQQFLPQIVNGEKSLIYLGGEFKYALIKKPKPNEFRSNQDYADYRRIYQPSIEEIEFGEKVCFTCEKNPGISRIDLVSTPNPTLLEATIVWPALYPYQLGQVHKGFEEVINDYLAVFFKKIIAKY